MEQVVRQPISKEFIYIQDRHQVFLQEFSKPARFIRCQAYHALEEFDECRLSKQEREGNNQSSLFRLYTLYELSSRFNKLSGSAVVFPCFASPEIPDQFCFPQFIKQIGEASKENHIVLGHRNVFWEELVD